MLWRSRSVVLLLAVAGVMAAVRPAAGQALGIGPRLSFVRDVPGQPAATRFVGGILRMQSSRRVVLEAALDYRVDESADGLERVRERPLQGSLLLFPVRAALAPYVLAGYGLYTRSVERLDAGGTIVDSVAERRTGAHFGLGAELFIGRHAAIVVDYRYRFVRFGEAGAGETPVNLPGLGRRLAHRGAMWTSGVAFYF